ncbi:MAG TPA: shikimate dehydrogenase [Phycisphaerae bacterium]|nr:shikimate dehydrogenase [Phycisphaerae bacterium]
MTNLICSVHEMSADETAKALAGLPLDPRIWVEVRLDGLPSDAIHGARALLASSDWPVIATCRSEAQGGQSTLSEAERLALLSTLNARYIDVEFTPGTAGHASPENPKVLSYHDFIAIPQNLHSLLAEMERSVGDADVAKIAWACEDICENIEALELLAARPGKRILICMGERGLMSRVLAVKVGAFGTFCAACEGRTVAPGQLSARAMLNQYRWMNINAKTKFLGVIGSPIAHSLSPAIFNAQFGAHGYDGVYLPLLITSEDELIRFLEACREKAWLDATGFSVTIPHKESVCRWLGDRADHAARRIGAVNTLHLVDGAYRGYNTDYLGIRAALRQGAGFDRATLASKRATVLGAGGAARAAVAVLADAGCDVTVFNRSPERAESLARDFGCISKGWEERIGHASDLIINCTSVGMWPNVDESPMPASALQANAVVFDTVYKPKQTTLLRDAEAAGCRTICGIEMFIQQAAAQYKIWTGADADLSLLRQTVESALDRDAQDAADGQR